MSKKKSAATVCGLCLGRLQPRTKWLDNYRQSSYVKLRRDCVRKSDDSTQRAVLRVCREISQQGHSLNKYVMKSIFAPPNFSVCWHFFNLFFNDDSREPSEGEISFYRDILENWQGDYLAGIFESRKIFLWHTTRVTQFSNRLRFQ